MNYKFANWQECKEVLPSLSVSSGEANKLFQVEFFKGEGKYVYFVNKEYPNIFVAGANGVTIKAEEDDFIRKTRVFFEAQKDGKYIFNLDKVLNNNMNLGTTLWRHLKGNETGEFCSKEDWSFMPNKVDVDCQLVRNYTRQIVFHIYAGTSNSQAFLLYAQGLSRHHCMKFENEPPHTEFGKKAVLSLIANRFNVDIENNMHISPQFDIPTFYTNLISDNLVEKFKSHIIGDDLLNSFLDKAVKEEEYVGFSSFIYSDAADLDSFIYPLILIDDFNMFDKFQNEKIIALSSKEIYIQLDRPNKYIKDSIECLCTNIIFYFSDEMTKEELNSKLEKIVK